MWDFVILHKFPESSNAGMLMTHERNQVLRKRQAVSVVGRGGEGESEREGASRRSQTSTSLAELQAGCFLGHLFDSFSLAITDLIIVC